MNWNKDYSLDIKISHICENEYNYFLNKKYVVGIALGYKITRGFYTYKKCITVFVAKKLSLNNLSREDIIPKCYKGILTDIVESGTFRFNSLSSRVRPVIQGYSIGNESSPECGTCGCLVKDRYLYILSSNHVLALNNTAKKESIILQPGTSDKGTIAKDVIGYLNRFVNIKFQIGRYKPENFVDCALCKVVNRSFVSSSIAFIGIPKGTTKPSLGLEVKKTGRTTEFTHGKITNLQGTFLISTPSKQFALFKNQIITTGMSAGGDSGALLLTKDNYAVGLSMSGSDSMGIFNSIDTVLKALKVELVTC